MAPWVWFSGAVLLSIAEVVGGEFVLLMLGGGALVTAGVALVRPGPAGSSCWSSHSLSVAFVVGLRPRC